ncbi:GxxExxY protein [Puniceicoccaceae bacterium K14]|nr:GxxExxY protein [Puniceicoccaceae bacterium K14]
MKSDPLTQTIIKACYQVHEELGTGFSEKVYENALIIALNDLGFESQQQHPINVYFRNQIVGEYFADIIVSNTIILELKTVSSLLPEHQAQLINYLTATNTQTGLLINFAKKGLEIKRLYPRK